jgi:hypothetical protein
VYHIQQSETGALIVDDNQNPVSDQVARQLIADLSKSYAPAAYIYLACNPTVEPMIYKIGYSAQEPEKRMSQLRYEEQNDAIFLLHTIACKSAESARVREAQYHDFFEDLHVRGEWFALPGYWIECLIDTESEEYINWCLKFHYMKTLFELCEATDGKCLEEFSVEEFGYLEAFIAKEKALLSA